MKKTISMGIACSVMALTSTAAFAESAQGAYLVAEKSSGEYVKGGTVTFSVKVTREGIKNGAFIVQATGLELVDSRVEGGEFSASTNTASFTGTSVAKGGVVAAFTYKVTANTGENVRFAISEHVDYPGSVDPIPVTGLVVEGTSTSGTQSTPATSSNNSVSSSNASSGNSNGTTGNPVTGIASTIVPAILAGAAVVVAARKRK